MRRAQAGLQTFSKDWRHRVAAPLRTTAQFEALRRGHDAVYMARLAQSGVIFIPCQDSISHNEIESATPEHLAAGANVLLHAMLERTNVHRG
jgi:N-carbamoyl-L-amino-acid hydrolase